LIKNNALDTVYILSICDLVSANDSTCSPHSPEKDIQLHFRHDKKETPNNPPANAIFRSLFTEDEKEAHHLNW
jgi:hypothetical protein